MKAQRITIIAAILLMINAVSVMGQSNNDKDESLRLRREREEYAKQKAQKELEKRISDGVEKQNQAIMNSKPEDGAKYQLRINQEKLSIVDNPSATLEQLKEASEFVITEGKDYVITEDGDMKLTSYHGFEVKTMELSSAIKNYNDYFDQFQKVRKECVDLNSECIKMRKNEREYGRREIDEKERLLKAKEEEKRFISTEAMRFKDEANKIGGTILGSTTDGNMLKKVSNFMLDLDQNKKVDDDYKNLMEYLDGCKDCGKQ